MIDLHHSLTYLQPECPGQKSNRRWRRMFKRQRTILSQVMCDPERRLRALAEGMEPIATLWLERARRIHTQPPKDKLHALHAPEVEYSGKGKACQAYEFGVKVGSDKITGCFAYLDLQEGYRNRDY